MFVTGLVLAAGSSRRLGTPKQLLPFRDTTVLGATLNVVRACGLDQVIVTLGGASDAVGKTVDLRDVDVVRVADFTSGCSSSLRAALPRVDRRADGIVLMLGDQPGVTRATVAALVSSVGGSAASVSGAGGSAMTVCRYHDGIGHPFWLGRTMFDELSRLHGDKGVWKLIDSGVTEVQELAVDGTVPLDVDTWDDYERLLATVPT